MNSAFAGHRAVVIGAQVAGIGAARVLAEEGADVRVSELRPAAEIGGAADLAEIGADLLAGGHDPSHLDGATLVVTSPGVPQDAPILALAIERGIPVWGELELGARLCTVPYVAVTGTNGKTTTTGMIAAMLRASGLDAVACGNIGTSFPDVVREGHEAFVVEASSFQLRFVDVFRPSVSVLLNLSPDHLDWHGSMEAYAAAKAKAFARQREPDTHVGNRDDDVAAALSATAPCSVVWFRLGEPEAGEAGYVDGELTWRSALHEVRLGFVDGERAGYRADAAAATAAAISFGIEPDTARAGLAAFRPERHRGEVVAVAGDVRFVDNSKATNLHAALAALDGVHAAVLIAGGRAKGVDLAPLASRADRLAAVVAIGEAAPDVTRVFDSIVPVKTAGTIEEATRLAYGLAPQPGTVLLAPACASWDMFRDYAERGDRFALTARAIEREATHRG